jgi:Uma2 family endonuclease
MNTVATDYELPMQVSHFPYRMRFDPPLTDKELEHFCARQEALHVERDPDGELEVRMIGGMLPGMVSARVLGGLGNWNERADTGVVLSNVGYFLPDGSMRGARISWVSKVQWQAWQLEESDGFPRGCPEFVIEIVSHNYTLAEMQKRMATWIANGVPVAWLIDPERKTVEIYRSGQPVEVHEGGTAVYGEDALAGFVLELAKIWAPVGTRGE